MKTLLQRTADLGLVAATCAAYAAVRNNGFVWDDAFLTERNPYLAVGKVGTLLTSDLWVASAKEEPSFYYRPLGALSLAVNRWFFGNSAASYHAVNVLLHALAALLVVRLVRALVPKTAPPVAWLAGLAFALLPIDSEAVAWIAGRFDLLGAVFALAALAAYARERTWSVVGLYAAATFSKESYLILPAAFVALDWAYGARVTKRTVGVLAASSAVAVLYLGIRIALRVPLPSTATMGPLTAIQSYATCVAIFARALVDARQVSLFHVYRPVSPGTEALVLGVVGAVTVALVRARRGPYTSMRGALASWLVMLLALVPIGLTAPVQFQLGDRYAYFPVACLLVTLACLANRFARRGWARASASLALAAVSAASVAPLERRLAEWRSSKVLFTAELARDPSRYWARQMLAEAAAEEGHYAEAEAELLRARKDALSTRYRIDVALCYVYVNENRLDRAIASCRRALDEFPVDPRAWVNLANAYLLEHHDAAALAAATQAGRFKPHYAEAAYVRAAALHELGRDAEARAAVSDALRFDPQHARARKLAEELGP